MVYLQITELKIITDVNEENYCSLQESCMPWNLITNYVKVPKEAKSADDKSCFWRDADDVAYQ